MFTKKLCLTDAFVITSRSEFCNAMVERQRLVVPIIASDIAALKEEFWVLRNRLLLLIGHEGLTLAMVDRVENTTAAVDRDPKG